MESTTSEVESRDAFWLKPMSLLEVLDGSLKLYRDNFALFLGITAVAYVPIAIVGFVMQALLLKPTTLKEDPAAGALGLFFGMFFLLLLLQATAVPIATGALTQAVSDRYLARRTTLGTCYRAVFRIFFSFLMTTLLVGLLVGLGFLACIVPGIFLMILFAFVTPIMILEQSVGTDALRRSNKLSEYHRLRIFGLGALMLLVSTIFSSILNVTCKFVLAPFIESEYTRALVEVGGSHVISLLLQPLWSVSWVLLYYDVRIRKEAFDLQLLALRTSTELK